MAAVHFVEHVAVDGVAVEYMAGTGPLVSELTVLIVCVGAGAVGVGAAGDGAVDTGVEGG